MGSGPALALLLLAALGTLHCCSPAAATAAGSVPDLSAADITLGQSARQLLDAFDATAGALSCGSAPYVAPLTVSTPGLYRFRVKALGTNTDSTAITSGVVLVGMPSSPTSLTYTGGVGKVTVLWQSPVTDPDPATTKYRLYATPSTSGTRRLLDAGQTSFVELTPSSGTGSALQPFNATAYLPAGNYTFQLSAWNAIGESALTSSSALVEVSFSTSPRFWTVQGSQTAATLSVIRPDSVAEPDNLRFKVAILKAGDSGSGTFRAAALESHSGTGTLADPAVISIPLSAFGSSVEYAQARFIVVATNVSGGFDTASVESPIVTVGRPPAPTGLTFATASINSVTVAWDTAPTAAQYEVRLEQTAPDAKAVSTAVVDGSSGTSFSKTFDNLTPGRYSVSVYSINANRDSSSSAAISSSDAVVGAPLPATIEAVQTGVGQLTVQWSAPSINADLGTTYTLTIRDVTAGRSPATEPLEGIAMSSTTHSVTSLVAGTKRVQITATNVNSGSGKYASAVLSALSDEYDVALSLAPAIASTNGVVGSAAGAAISVTAPGQMSTTALNKFLIQAYHATENTELGKPIQVDAAESDSAGPWTVTWPQTAPQLLRFKVAAQSDDRTVTSPWSSLTDVVAVGTPDRPVIAASPAPAGGVDQVSLSWSAVYTAVSYHVRIYRSGELVQTRTATAPTVSHTETGLGWGMYTVEVAAVSANGVIGPGVETSPLTVGKPGKPDAPTTVGGIGTLTLTWQKPAADPDPASTAFFAKIYNAAGTTLVTGPVSLAGASGDGSSETPFVKTINLPFGEYTATIYGRNVNGDGDESDKSAATKVELSNKPAVISVAGYADKAVLTVLRPETLANVNALSYKVVVYDKAGAAITGKEALVPTADSNPGTIYTPTSLTLSLSQLTDGGAPGQFKFRVVAVGGPTDMPADDLTPLVTVGVPATPTGITADGGLSSATINWSASATSAYYLVELLAANVVKHSARVAHSDATATYTQTFNNVAAGTYSFRLTAVNGNSPAATDVSGIPATSGDVIVGVPGQPRLTTVVGSVGKATITWQQPSFNPSSVAAATTYWLRTYLVNSADGTWAEQGTAAEISRTDATVERTLYAGVYRFAMFTRNVNGDGPDSDLTDPVTVGFANAVTSASAVGARTQATLAFSAPSELCTTDGKVAKFRVQAIREDGLVVEEARELALAAPVDESTASLQLVFAWPSAAPQRLKFRLAATDSTFAGPWSAETNTVTVGQPAAPVIRASEGLPDSASVTFDAVPYAVTYDLVLLRCTGTTPSTCTEEADAKSSQTSAGQHTFGSVSAPGLYAIAVTASAANGVASDASTTPMLLVGKPGAPAAGPTVTVGVGNATFSWEAPAVNPDATGVVDPTRYTLRVYTTDGSTLIHTQALSGLGGQDTSAAPYSKLVTLVAGTWKATITASNKHGESESPLSAQFTVGVTSKPTISSVQGGPSGLTLEVYRPSDISAADARYLTYLVQLYDADSNSKLGNEIRVNSDSGDGTVAGGAFTFVVPYAKPQRLTAEVIADAGATRSQPSERTGLVVVGTPDKPTITSVSGSPSAAAPFSAAVTFPKVYTADSYSIVLEDLNVPANSYSYELTPTESAAGPFTRNQTVTTKGTYRFKVVASNAHATPSAEAESTAVVVGLPDVPTLPADAVTATVGKITLKWTAPHTNDFIGTQYTALLYRPTNLTAPIFSLALAADGTTAAGTTSFSEDVALPAGPYRLEIATANVHGDGAKSSMTAEFTVGISTTPSISSISGDTSGATLRVMRPGTMADDAVASYVIQAYTDAEASTKFGEEVRGNNTEAGADGKTPDTAFVFPYPYTTAAKLWFKVTVLVGGTRSSASDAYGPVIMGTPAKPTITGAAGGPTLDATINYTRAFTATSYVAELIDVNVAGSSVTNTLAVADTEAGPWSSTLTVPAKGTYRFQLTASNTHGAHGPVAESEAVVLGLPDAPTLAPGTDGINPGVGKLTLTWSAPQTNAFIGTKYTLNLYRPANTTAPVFSAVLSAAGTTAAGITTFTQQVQVPAGPYTLEITTANVHGAGDKTALSSEFTVGVSSSASIAEGTGSTSGALLKVLRPENVSDDTVATYLIQAYTNAAGTAKYGEEVRGSNTASGANGLSLATAFAFPYPSTAAAKLWFTVTVVVGGTRSPASPIYGPIIMGTPAKPTITLAAGGPTLEARINYTRTFTSTTYLAELTNVNDAADTLSDTLAVADTEEGPWSRTLTMTTKGTYRFKLTASNEHGDHGPVAESDALVLGLPDVPTLPADAVTATVGKITLKWTAPHTNDFIGTQYTALLYRPTNLTAPIFSLALAADGTTAAGTTSFSEDVALPAGPYRLEIATANVHGDGAKSSMTAEFTVGISTTPSISSISGDTSGATLRVMRPGTMADDAVASYVIQAYTDAEASTKFGKEVRGNNTEAGADGKTPDTAFVFPYPYTTAAKLWFKVTVLVGGTRSSASDAYGPVIMGTPAKPTITGAAGGPTLDATINYTRAFTATSYVAELIDVNVAGSSVTNTLAVADTEAGPWSSTLTVPAKGTYRFQLTASNTHGAHGPVAESEAVVLGLPDAPTLAPGTDGINPGVGKLTLTWSAPQTNAFIGTKYTLNLYRPANTTAPVFSAVLSAAGTTAAGITTFTQQVQVPAGPYTLEITTANVHGAGDKTALSSEFTVGVSSSASIAEGTGSTSGALLKVLRPENVSDDTVATYLIQAYTNAAGTAKYGEEVRGSNTASGANGLSLATAFAFPYPSTAAAKLWFTVTVVVGGTRSPASPIYGPIIMGTPAKPTITLAAGGPTLEARINYTRTFTSTTYLAELTNVNDAADTLSDTLAVADTEEGPWSSTLTVPAKGTYRFKLTASNEHGDHGPVAESDALVLGLPDVPTLPADAVTATVGKITLKWTAPHTNDFIGTQYTALLYRPTNLTAPIFSLALAADGTTAAGTTSFSEDVALPAGPYRLEIATANVHGDGAKSSMTAEFTVGISTTPSISSISGDTSGATLRVMRPGTMADDAVASYVIQAYTDAEASTKFGEEVRGNNTEAGADGKTPDTAFVFPYPYTTAAKLWFKVTVLVGGTRSSASDAYGPVIMGTPAKPTITGAAGGPTLDATINYTRAFTATSYVAELIDVNVAGSSVTNTLAVADTEAGPWSSTLTVPAKGTYRFKLTASNEHGDHGPVAESDALVLGLPDVPTLPADAVTATVGKITLKWTAPHTNDFIGTQYTALLYRPTNLTAPIFSLALAADGTTAAGTTSFSEDVALPAGPYRLEIATANVHGDGAKSSMTAEFTVGISTTPSISSSSGDTSGATLCVMRPGTMADDAVASYVIQAYTDAEASTKFGEEVRGNNTEAGADGKTPDTAFVFPYPYTTAAKLWFKVTVLVGGTRSSASDAYGPVIMGTPAKPTITGAAGGPTLDATINYTRAFTATSYVAELIDVNVAGSSVTNTLAVADTEAGPWSSTLTVPAKGTYRFQLTASNTHGAHGPVAESEAVVLGLPDAPTLAPGTDGINPGVGKLTLTWSAPQTNAFIGTKYTLNLYRPANTTAPVFSAVLSAAGTTAAGITTFTQQVQVPAGPYTLEITTANVHGAGDKTALSSEFTVGVSSSASIAEGTGSTSGALLKVLRPENVSDDTVATYLIQAYTNAAGTAKYGEEVRGSNTASGANGLSLATAFAFPYPSTAAAKLWFTVTVVVGGTRSPASPIYGPIIMGTPAKPTITLAAGGPTLEARINYTRTFTSTTYLAELTNVNDAADTLSDTLAVADTEEGPWSRTLTMTTKGTYRFKLTASNEHGDHGPVAESDALVLGLPDVPTLPADAVTATVGKITLKWTAPHTNDFIGTQYTALLYRPTNLTAPIFSLALAADGTTAAGTTSFSEDVALPAGPYRLEIATANVHGDGAKSSMTAEFTVGISTTPSISSISGDTSGATLRVMRPGTMADDAVASYVIQAYTDAEASTKFGEEVRGNNTEAGADGKTPDTAFVFPYPYTTAAKLWFKVTVLVGGTRSSASDAYGPVIMGTPAKPTITGAAGGPTLDATINYTRAFTATSYVAELIDVNVAGSSVTNTLAVADTEAGPWSSTLTVPAKGTYRFQLTASNTHGAHGPVAESEAVVLGLPDAPTLAPGTDGINPGVGKLTLTWSAPQTNAFIGTKYTLNLYRPANTTAPVFSAVLSAAGTTAAGITTFTQQVQVPAGPYTLEITTANVHGAGDKTALSSEFTVGVSSSASIAEGTGSTSGALLKVLRPENVSDDTVATYLIQAYTNAAGTAKYGEEVRGSNTASGANGLSLATAFAFPYPSTAAAKLWFTVTVVVGGTRSPASPIYGPIIMGTPAKPTITLAAGGPTLEARINYTRTFTSTTYLAELTNVNDAADTLSDTLAVADTEEGPWSRTLTMTTKGTYRFKLTASNEHGDHGPVAESDALVLGLPDVPTLPADAVTATVGKITLKWTAPHTNDFIGTQYTALLYRPTNLTAPIFSLALAADGTTAAGTTSFSEDVALPAGPYRLEIATANVHGDGAKSSMTAEFTVGISTTPSISSISGDTSGATLRVMRPGTMADDAVASYVIQAYTDAEASTKFGEEVRGNNTEAGADGKTPDTAFVFPYPYTTAAKLWFKVTVLVGGTRSSASDAYGPVIMGTPAKPTITGAAGGPTLDATINYTRAFTATSYVAELIDVNVAGSSVTNTLAVADTEAGPWSSTLTVPAKGTYRFQLTASNTHGAHGPVAESEAVVLGLPDAPTLAPGTDGINPGVGKLTLTWSAPQTNAFIGTKYTLNLYRPANTTAPVFSAVLSAAGTTAAGITTFTQQVQVPAGPYTLEITTANVHGAGDKTALSSEFTVGVSSSASIAEGTGSTSGALLKVLRPENVSDDTVATYLIQAYTNAAGTAKYGEEVRGSNTASGANGLSLATAFAFPYPSTAAAKLWFTVTVVVGGTRSPASPIYGPIIMGTPAKPTITLAAGGPTLEARINYTRTFTSTTYLAELTNVNDAADTLSDTLAVADTEEGPWSRTLTMTTKGTYRFKLTASNEHGDHGPVAESDALVLGLPDVPTLPADAVTATVGKITLKWTAPHTNDFIGTQYTALLYRPTNLTAPIFSLALAADGTTAAGTTSFSEDVALPAGPYRLEIATANVHGDGAKSSMTAEFTVGISTTPSISSISGDTSGATLRVMRPGTMADDAVASYVIQAYTDAEASTKFGEEVRGNNTEAGADGKTPDTAFVFPYPYTTAAKLWFKVTVLVGGTRSEASEVYGPIVVGTPATPRLVSPLGGKDGATFTFTAVLTAVKYIVTAFKDGTALSPAWTLPDASGQQVWSLTDLGGQPGQFAFSVVAENANGAQGEAANTSALVVGTPGAPAWVATNPVVAGAGTAHLSWTAPAYNAKIDTQYYAQLWRDGGATKFGGPVALAATQAGEGTAQAPFTATIDVSAGSWSYQLLTNNTWGAGEASDKTQAVEQAVADTPVIKSLAGGITTATLTFLKPTNASNQDTITYHAQLYDASASPATKLGEPVVLNVTGGEGTDAQPYVASLGPFSQARIIAVAIQASGGAGGFSTALSAQSAAVVVGTPSKPGISQASGSNGATASLTISKVFTATNYTIVLVDVNSAANVSEVLSPAAAEAGPWTRSLTAPAKGTYRFEVTATNEHKATSDKTVSEAVVVGLPDAPALPADAVTAAVGKITLKWTAPQTNAAIGTKYTALLYRPANTSAPYLILALKAAGTTSFSEELALPAGPYRLEIATANVHGDGAKSSMTAEFTVGVSSSPTIIGGSGDASGATLRSLRPDNMSDDAVATYLIQAYSDAAATTKVGTEVRGNNTATGADGKAAGTAFVFPYPWTTGSQLWFKVTVVVGGTRSPSSGTYGPIVVGTPATPRVLSPAGSKERATFNFTAVPTAVNYTITALKDGTPLSPTRTVATAGQQVWSLADLGGEPGQFTFSVVARNERGTVNDEATTSPLIVGTPGAPAWVASSPVTVAFGTTKLTWTAPAYNADIGTRYYVQLWRDEGATKFGSPVALAPTQDGDGTAQAPFTATINTTAGSWSYQLLTNNTWGAGGSSAKTQPVGQPLSDKPTIQSISGGASTATLRFLKPASATDQDTITFRAQLYDASTTPPTELGTPVALNASGAGTTGSPYVATLGPFAQPLRITVAVQATGGAGSMSTALSDQSTPVVVGLPLVPQIESFTGSKTELRVTWLKNDTTATSYRIAVFKAGVFVAPVVEVPAASLGDAAGTADDPFSFAIPAANRPDPNRYAVKVAAVNTNGAGPWSALSQVAVFGAPAAPSGVPAVALADPNVRVTFNKADSTAVKYSAFLKPTTGTEVEVPLAVKPVNDSTTQLFALVAPDPPELPQGGIYTLQIAAYNANDDLGTRSASSAAFQLGTVAPTAPVGVAANPSARAATVSFQAPASTGGSLITSYEVELLLAGDSQGVRTFQASALFKAGQYEGNAARPFSVALSNLAPGSWTFVVTAVNKNGRASAASTAPVTVPDVPPTKPAIAAISGTDSTVVSGVTTQTINLSVLKPTAGGEVIAWAYSLWNTARTVPFITKQPFTPTDGDGTTIDPYTAVLTIPNLPDGVYRVTVTATTATGSATSNFSPQVALGTPPTPTVTAVTSTTQNVTVRVSVPQTVTVAARNAKSTTKANTKAAKSISIAAGTTAASQPTVFTVTLNPTLGTGLKPLTRRVKSTGGTGTAGNPYTLVVPVTQRSEWTVQAVTGSNVNGASDADDWPTPVATGVPDAASFITVNGARGFANITFTSAPAWTTGATVRVRVINSVTLADEAFQGADGLLPFTSNPDTMPYIVPAAGANQWSAIIRNANNNVGTVGSPIPHVGTWRFRISVVNRAGGESALSVLTSAVEVGGPAQVVAPGIAQSSAAGLVMNVNIRTGLVTTAINNPPAVTGYLVRIYRGPATNSTAVKTLSYTPDQAKTVQAVNLATLGLQAGTYSVSTFPVGANGAGAESARSNYVAMQTRRSVRPVRRMAETQQSISQAQPQRAGTQGDARDEVLRKRHRNRHLL
ncbi:Ig-like domain repeat [Chlorella sorokiniana]|uniref:Ig-like domain repeat n=1 Tax=Chlorella sorokiniana TaxID=3076 RepID=A0A2P6TDX0_CHLSO|nr:Ig-like domain repeat [Chlorella sorokiniana]|eukprot:PRW20837.1 Ig-like domain repeat [Chlorella sorokiniana]